MQRTLSAPLGMLLFALAWAIPALAQEAKPKAKDADIARLETLLRELAETPPDLWQARLAALQAKHKAMLAEAEALEKKAKELSAAAVNKREAAKAVLAEQERMNTLRKIAEQGFTLPEPKKPAPKEPTQKKPTQKKPTEKPAPKPAEPEPKKPEPKKAETKNAPPAKATPNESKPSKAEAKPQPAPPVAPAASAKAPAKTDNAPPQFVSWEHHIEDILLDECSVCHEPGDSAGGFDATSFDAVRRGGASGQTLTPGNPDGSRLFAMVTHREQPVMPKDADRLPKAQLDLLRRWIEQGASRSEADAQAFVAEQKRKAKKDAEEAAALEARAQSGPLPQFASMSPLAVPVAPLPARAIARSPTAQVVAVPGVAQVLLLREDDGQLLAVLATPFPAVQALAFSEDGAWLAAAGGTPGKRGSAVCWDVESGELLGTFGRLRDTAFTVAVQRATKRLAVGGPDKGVSVFPISDSAAAPGDKVTALYKTQHTDWVLACAFSPDGTYLASADRKGRLWLWQGATGKDVRECKGHNGAINALAFDPLGRSLASVGDDGTLRTWDVATGKQRWSKPAHAGGALAVAYGAESLATGGADGRLRLWKTNGAGATSPKALADWVYAVALGPGDRSAWAGTWRGEWMRYDREGAKSALCDPWATPAVVDGAQQP